MRGGVNEFNPKSATKIGEAEYELSGHIGYIFYTVPTTPSVKLDRLKNV